MDSVLKIPQQIHESGIHNEQKAGKKVSKKLLINKLNYINFQDGTILINLRHKKYNNTISLHAKPQPSMGDQLHCQWTQTEGLKQKLRSHTVQSLSVNEGQKLFLVKADVITVNEKEISFNLPEICYEVSARKVKRHPCKEIKAQLIQNSALFHGSLIDFSAVSFRVEVTTSPPQTFQWVISESPLHLILSGDHETLYSGECRILKQTCGPKTRTFVLEPLSNQIRRFKPKESRSTRHKLIPSPNIIFRHPLTGKTVDLEVVDLSGSGFSVEEDGDSTVLLPGMIIPELELSFANSLRMKCKAQIIYKKFYETDKVNRVKCGLAILDMDIEDHVRLLALVHQAKDRKSYICNKVDMDALWNFFFETGFIYPKKYAFIHANKEKFKETYEKLYTRNPNIARHFIYQDNGVILGHLAMLRYYENTWLIHHHAASKSESNRAGLVVLDQLARSINDCHNLYSAHMNFVACYYRPDNKFPNRIFGGIARHLNEPKACSLDTFAFFHYQREFNNEWDMLGPWGMAKTKPEDLRELESFYEHESGGLMTHALDMEPGSVDHDELSKEYNRLGFKRERHLFSLKRGGTLKAVFMVNATDVGLNMSELTNCITVIVLDPDELPKDTLYLMLSILSIKYEQNDMPVLLYPFTYADNQSISYEKLYNLWVLNIPQAGAEYLKLTENLLARTQCDLVKAKQTIS
ncbi:MAG: hypothetical protein FD174_1136 [Geobacteraceae bacterium]|nr:MAG: hypothetical protein FD174_1136 [Geobacteraceae bacterium]